MRRTFESPLRQASCDNLRRIFREYRNLLFPESDALPECRTDSDLICSRPNPLGQTRTSVVILHFL
jgi:hypothetical protein